MRQLARAVIAMLVFASAAEAQTWTRTATFENFTAGQSFKPAFTDPVSGIRFYDSTHPSGGFVIDYSSTYFGPGNYLTAGVGPVDGLGSDFGFTSDLPSAADQVSLDVSYVGGLTSLVILRGYALTGELVAEQAGPPDAPRPFHLAIHSDQFNIVKAQVSVGAIDIGYDNVSYRIVPEPSLLSLIVFFVWARRGRRCR